MRVTESGNVFTLRMRIWFKLLHFFTRHDSTVAGAGIRILAIKFVCTLDKCANRYTRPHRVRRSMLPEEVINFIKDMREKHPRIGKEKLKPLLDKYSQERRITTISVHHRQH